MKIAIVGGPRTGKTTLGEAMALRSGTALLSTDSLIALGWSEASQAVAALLLTEPGDLIVEGVAVARALRKALAQTDGAPCGRVIVLESPHVALTPGQATMAKGVATVWTEIVDVLRGRGVEVMLGP